MEKSVVISGIFFVFLLFIVGCGEEAGESGRPEVDLYDQSTSGIREEKKTQYLLTLVGTSGTYSESGELILSGLDPDAIYFSERPDRRAGKLAMADFMKIWSDSASDSFLSDPPNALLSVFNETNKPLISVIELTDAKITNSTARFMTSVHEGTIPPAFGPATLVIDGLKDTTPEYFR